MCVTTTIGGSNCFDQLHVHCSFFVPTNKIVMILKSHASSSCPLPGQYMAHSIYQMRYDRVDLW